VNPDTIALEQPRMEGGMLDPEQVDLADLALALEDQVEPLPTAVSYGDMEEFVAQVRDPRARGLLERAITGRGAFRRVKDTLLEYPELRLTWFAFRDARSEQRAIEWLLRNELIPPAAAEEALEQTRDPDAAELPGLLDAVGVARRAARDLRRLYGARLRDVLLVGARARGDAHPEAAIELLVVLAELTDRCREKTRMDKIMWRHSIRHETVVTETPIAEQELERGVTPLAARARAEGVRVG
jgi:hypothetical protein